jgi:hypothetical protein
MVSLARDVALGILKAIWGLPFHDKFNHGFK